MEVVLVAVVGQQSQDILKEEVEVEVLNEQKKVAGFEQQKEGGRDKQQTNEKEKKDMGATQALHVAEPHLMVATASASKDNDQKGSNDCHRSTGSTDAMPSYLNLFRHL